MNDDRTAPVWDAVDAVTSGDASTGIAEYVAAVSKALEEDRIDRREQRTARQDAVDALDSRVWTANGAETDWGFLSALAVEHGGNWLADEVLAATVARNVVRAEHEADWGDVPASAVGFLGGIRPVDEGGSTPAWETSFSYYGWAFRHPSVDAAARIRNRGTDDSPVWGPSAAACAAHIDFGAALSAVRDIATVREAPATTFSYLVTIREDCFPGRASIAGWDWTERYGYRFRWLESRVRAAAAAVEEVVGVDVCDHSSIEAVSNALDEPMREESR